MQTINFGWQWKMGKKILLQSPARFETQDEARKDAEQCKPPTCTCGNDALLVMTAYSGDVVIMNIDVSTDIFNYLSSVESVVGKLQRELSQLSRTLLQKY